jgi:hypothetical protein
MNWFIDNRELIKHLAINTGTSQNPVYKTLCTTSEVKLNTELEEKDFYVYCDAIKRKIVTGAEVSLEGTLKLDVNNEGDIALLDKAHTLISSGEIAQFSNVGIQFDLLSGVEGGVLEYTTYRANVTLSLSDIGGNAEDEAGMSFTMSFIGTATEVASA